MAEVLADDRFAPLSGHFVSLPTMLNAVIKMRFLRRPSLAGLRKRIVFRAPAES